MDLPYLAPWVDTERNAQRETEADEKALGYTTRHLTAREDPSMTANMPYLAPWNEHEEMAIERARDGHDILLVRPPPVDLHDR